MRFARQIDRLWLILGILGWGDLCRASNLGARIVSPKNSTSSFSPSSIPVDDLLVATPTTTLPPNSTVSTSTITSPPVYPWGDQVIPINTCNFTQTDGQLQWTPCRIFAGTIQFSYFPESSGNVSYPATYYNDDFSVTMTSPSVYMKVNTLTGANSCGQLGPTYADVVISMDLTEVYTVQPYADHTVTTRMGPPQQLALSDLENNCFETYSSFSTDGAWVNTHPVYGNYNRCHPRFVPPIQLKRIGYPYWMHCSNDDYNFGIFDPPGAVPPVSGLLASTTAADPVPTSTYDSASAIATAVPEQASSTSLVVPPASSLPSVASPSSPGKPQSSTAPSSPPGSIPISTDPTAPGSTPDSTSPAAAPNPTSLTVNPTDPGSPAASGNLPITTPSIAVPTSPTVIATIGSNTISAIPGGTGIILSGSTAKPGSVETLTDSNSKPIVVSVGTSGVYIAGTGAGGVVVSSYYPNPTIAPIPVVTVGTGVISAAPGATNIVIDGQTAYLGGEAVTVSTNIIKLTPSGIVVADTNGGSSSTYAIPTLGGDALVVAAPAPIATIGGQVISAAPGASTLAISGQTVVAGGPPITLRGSHNIVSLGPDGLIVQYPGGAVSNYALPTTAPNPGQLIGTVDGIAISAPAGATTVVLGSQTVSLNGPPVTLPNNDVVTWGSSGLVVQSPGGGVSTLSMQTRTAAGVVTSLPTASSSKGIASIIASIAGAGSATATKGTATSPPLVTENSGGRLDLGSPFGWMMGCLMLSFIRWV